MLGADDLQANKLLSMRFVLGEQEALVLRRTYAHLMGHFMVAFTRPEPGKHHPGPWKHAAGGFTADVTSELFIPKEPGISQKKIEPILRKEGLDLFLCRAIFLS